MLNTISVSAQSKKTEKLLLEGVELNDIVKINNALSNGAKPNDGLIKSIQQKNIKLVKLFIENGADPSQGLKEAVVQNNIDIVEYLLGNGAHFLKERAKNIDGEVYLQISKGSPLIPIYYLKGRWMLKNPNNTYSYVENIMKENSVYVFSQKEIIMGNRAILSAINNDNFKMVQLLLKNGINAKDSCIVKYYNILGNAPTPALILRPIEYAISKNANSSIVELLQKNDDTKNFRFTFEKVSFIYENKSDNVFELKTNDFAIICTKKVKNENIFGAKLFYSIDNLSFNEIKFIGYPRDSTINSIDFTNSVTKYFYNVFGDSIHPKEIIFKIDINSYGDFIDTRNGEHYRTAKIGNLEVLAENFRFKAVNGCWIYNNDAKNLEVNGYLYTEEAANLIAPNGWHLPSIEEWDELYEYCGDDFQSLVDALLIGGGTGFDLYISGIHSMFGYSLLGNVAVFRCSEPNSNINLNFGGATTLWTATTFHINETNHAKCGFSVRLFKDR